MQKLLPLLLLLAPLLLGASGSCTFGSGQSYRLGVPFRAQEQFNYCVPASIQMWRLYNGFPDTVSQSQIATLVGVPGCNLNDVPSGLSFYAGVSDAYADLVFSPSQQQVRELVARQITSIDRRSPVIPIVGARNHVGVINGGKYHQEGTGFVWDFVYFHDPGTVADDYYAAANWLDFFCDASLHVHCGQAVSSSATSGWKLELQQYGSNLQIGGASPGFWGPPEY